MPSIFFFLLHSSIFFCLSLETPHRLFRSSLYKVCFKMDTYESHQPQEASSFYSNRGFSFLPLLPSSDSKLLLSENCKLATFPRFDSLVDFQVPDYLVQCISLRDLEDRAAFDSVPPQIYEPNLWYHDNQNLYSLKLIVH